MMEKVLWKEVRRREKEKNMSIVDKKLTNSLLIEMVEGCLAGGRQPLSQRRGVL